MMELLMEGRMWGPQVNFIGALINANNPMVWVFDTEAATQVYTNGEPPTRTIRNWSSLGILLFPLAVQNTSSR